MRTTDDALGLCDEIVFKRRSRSSVLFCFVLDACFLPSPELLLLIQRFRYKWALKRSSLSARLVYLVLIGGRYKDGTDGACQDRPMYSFLKQMKTLLATSQVTCARTKANSETDVGGSRCRLES
jgi:hypothetical protein